MKLFRSKNVFRIAVLCLLVGLSIPIDVLGQGRGRRAGRGQDKKCEKFVNCHDARDGRWDGRGPRRSDSLVDRILGRSRRTRRVDDDDDFRRSSRRERRQRRLNRDDYYRGRRGF